MAGEIKWIKVITDIFEDEKVKLIKSMPEGRTLVLIWFQLLVQAGKTNAAGWIYLSEGCAYTPSMLATLFNETQQMVELAIKLLSTKPFEMIEVTEDGLIYIPNWEKHQNVESMDKIREKERLRKARQREKQKLLLSRDSHGTGHGTSLESHAIELEVDLEKESKYTTDDFEVIRVRFRELHGLIDMPIYDSPIVTKLLNDGIPSTTIISVMERKFKKSASTIKYYEAAIREAHNGVVAVRHIKKYDPELESRNEEIARNRWIAEGNDPSGFVYKPASGD